MAVRAPAVIAAELAAIICPDPNGRAACTATLTDFLEGIQDMVREATVSTVMSQPAVTTACGAGAGTCAGTAVGTIT